MKMLQRTLAVAACGLICGCGTTNTPLRDPPELPTSGTFVHPYSKFSFPEILGSFRRVNVRKYDQQGKDVSVGYSSSSPVAVTVYVYPGAKDFALLPVPKSFGASESVLDQHFQVCKWEVLQHHRDAKLLGQAKCKLIQGNQEYEGRKAVFMMAYEFGLVPQDSISELYVFVIEPGVKFLLTERQFVKYRITYPVANRVKAETEVRAFMGDLVWPTR